MRITALNVLAVTVILVTSSTSSTNVRILINRIVHTKYGPVRGRVVSLENAELRHVDQYLGVPYASPPVDQLRFMPPNTCDPWTEARSADSLPPVCPQILPNLSDAHFTASLPPGRLQYLKRLLPYLKRQSEDCLYLNIYKPAQVGHDTSLLSVLVFLHGESYTWNSGNPYDGSVLASAGNIMVITINFRLGVLGFLTTMDDSARGNYGLMDQIAALHWIEENISHFGGDPRNITLMGHSTGAASVQFLMMSPVAKGLFNRVILMSGSALAPWAVTKTGAHQTAQLAAAVGCPIYDSQHLVHCLRGKSLDQILGAKIKVPLNDVAFGPTIDGLLLPDDPENYMEDEKRKKLSYDLLIGVTKVEEYFNFTLKQITNGMSNMEQNLAISSYIPHITSWRNRELLAMLKNEYTDWTKTNQHPMNILNSVFEVLGDARMISPVIKSALLNHKCHETNKDRQKKIFLYVFSYQTRYGDYPTRFGAIHGEELAYLFGAPLLRNGVAHFKANYSSAEESLSEAIIALWSSFTKNGDPNMKPSSRGSKYNKINWPPYDVIHQKYISLNIRPRIRDHYRAHKLSMWLNLIPQLENIPYEKPEVQNNFSLTKIPWEKESVLVSFPIDEVVTTKKPINSTTVGTTVSPMPTNEASDLKPLNTSTKSDKTFESSSATYSTALTLTIIVGCSLLVLNILSFAGMYYQQRKFRRECKMSKNGCQDKLCPSANTNSKESPITPTFYHHQVQNQVLPALATIKRGSLLDRGDEMTTDWTTIYNMTTLSVRDTKFHNPESNTKVPEEEETLLSKSVSTTSPDSRGNTAGTQV